MDAIQDQTSVGIDNVEKSEHYVSCYDLQWFTKEMIELLVSSTQSHQRLIFIIDHTLYYIQQPRVGKGSKNAANTEENG